VAASQGDAGLRKIERRGEHNAKGGKVGRCEVAAEESGALRHGCFIGIEGSCKVASSNTS